MALTHFPVLNKNGVMIASAITNLDMHDLSRAAKTYGVQTLYVVTPLEDQKKLAEKIVLHWTNGLGSGYNPERKKALELVCVKHSLNEVIDHICKTGNDIPKTIVTSAKDNATNLSFSKFRKMLQKKGCYLLIFGTAWGLAENLVSTADYRLSPVTGSTDYNHLSVRSAAAIILDRLLGNN